MRTRLEAGPTTPRLRTLPYLAPSESYSVNFTGIVNATIGDPISVNATLLYDDVANRSIGPKFTEWVDDVQAPPPLRSDLTSVLAVFSFAVVAIVAAIVIAPILGERNLTIDEVFLVHRSGVLIQHLRQGSTPDLRKDDDPSRRCSSRSRISSAIRSTRRRRSTSCRSRVGRPRASEAGTSSSRPWSRAATRGISSRR